MKQRWMGVAAMQQPFDFLAISDIIYEVQPDVIVETGARVRVWVCGRVCVGAWLCVKCSQAAWGVCYPHTSTSNPVLNSPPDTCPTHTKPQARQTAAVR